MNNQNQNEPPSEEKFLEKPTTPTGQPKTIFSPPKTPSSIIRFKRPEFIKNPFQNRKFAAWAFLLLIILLGGITLATAWRLRRVEKVTPEEAEAYVGLIVLVTVKILLVQGNMVLLPMATE